MRLRALLVMALVAPLLVLLASPAHATTIFTVTGKTDPSPTPACAGTVCPSLRAAVAAANLSPGAAITLGSGTYQLSHGKLTLSGSMTIAGAGSTATTIQQTGADRLVDAPGASTTIDIQDLTLTGGHVVGASFPPASADSGAIFNAASMTLTRVRLTGNSVTGGSDPAASPGAGENGGAAHASAIGNTGSLILISSTVSDNTTQGGAGQAGSPSGGGGSADGTISVAAGSLMLIDTTLANNVVAGGDGGTVLTSSGTGGVGGSTFGGVVVALPGDTVTVRGSTFVGNHVTGGAGPSTFDGHSGNGGDARGAAIYADGVPLDLVNSTFTQNVAAAGAGGTIDPSALSGSAGAAGSALGGAVETEGTTSASFASVTFSNNAAIGSTTSHGGNLALEGSVAATLGDSIVQLGSAGGLRGNCDAIVTPSSAGHNLEDSTPSQCGFQAPAGDLIGQSAALGSLANNGGTTQTMLPAGSSPVIDAGGACIDPTSAPVGPLTVDQRGAPRPSGGPCDIGAVQIRAPSNTVVPSISPARPAPGQTATCNHGTFVGDGTLTYTYTWTRDAALLPQSTATYPVVAGDLGHVLRCTVVAHSAAYGHSSVPATSAPQTVTPPAPVLSAVRQSHATWRLPSRTTSAVPIGTTFRFGLSEPGTVTLTFSQVIPRRLVNGRCVPLTAANRSRPVCSTLYVVRGHMVRTCHVGGNGIAFAGRLSTGRYLRPGRYMVTFSARNAGGKVSRPVTLRFTIVA